MRVWRNWQTRQTQDLVLTSAGSSPVTRTIILLVLWCSWLTCQSVTLEIAGSSPVGTAILNAPVVQLDRILDYGSRGWGFESSRACHLILYIFFGTQLSLVEHLVWDQRVTGSNPAVPTINKQVQFNGRTPAFQAGYAGSIPVTCSIFFKIQRSSLKEDLFFIFIGYFSLSWLEYPLFLCIYETFRFKHLRRLTTDSNH